MSLGRRDFIKTAAAFGAAGPALAQGASAPNLRVVRFVVRPVDCWGNKGAAIASPWRRYST